jgi:hypothetical protein
VINNSGVEQTFNGTFRFEQFGATAGPLVTFNASSGLFAKGTNAGSATYINTGRISFLAAINRSGSPARGRHLHQQRQDHFS